MRNLEAALAFLLLALAALPASAGERLRVSTTTSTENSGLLAVLLPPFENRCGCNVDVVSVGTGKALKLGEAGDVDVVFVHARKLEDRFMANGYGVDRRDVMYNDFVLLGPADDPAGVGRTSSAPDAFREIAAKGSPFISRGDESGTHQKEKEIWASAGIAPKGAWYIESGQGMGTTLGIANDRNGYTITDRATYLAFRKRVSLAILLEGDRPLLNIYSVMEVNPANGPRINAAGGKTFADFMVAPETQAVIKSFGVEKFGQPLFIPVAGMREEQVGE